MYLKNAAILGMALVLGLAGCARYRPDLAWPPPRPLSSDLSTFRPPVEPDQKPVEPLSLEEPTGAITLRQALALALMRNPELRAFSWEVRVQEAATLQAGLLPNPEVSPVVEDIGGPGAFTSIQLSQLIELGGKRFKRAEAASLTRDLAGWDYETKRIDLFAQVSFAFIEVLGAQRNLVLQEELVRLAEEVAGVVSERVKAGKVSPIEETRANVALSSARIELQRARRGLEASRKRLAATWGNTTPRFKRAEGEIESVSAIPALEQLAERLSQNPEIARWATEMAQRQAVLDLQRSQAIPDLFVSGGVRRFTETNDNTFVVGVTVPFPIFNRNQGGIREAEYRFTLTEEERRAAEVRVTTLLAEAYRALSTAHAEVTALQADVLPGAKSAFEAVNEGYRLGKFGLLDVLDAQRTLFGARAQYLNALTDYHQVVAEVERLIGEPLDGVQDTLQEKMKR